MKIICPACGFNRDVPPERLPGDSVTATCPKCGEKFRVQVKKTEEEEDIRITASRAYQAEQKRFEKEAAQEESMENPWDLAPWPQGWFAAFLQTIFRVMFSPSRFYNYLLPRVSFIRTLLFFSIIIIFQSVIDRLWGQFLLSGLTPEVLNDPQLEEMLNVFTSDDNFIMSILIRFGALIFQLYLFSFILYITYRAITPNRSGFELVFQVMAYSYAPLVLCVVPVLGSLIGMIWSLACLLCGLKIALRINWIKTLIGFSPLIILSLPVFSVLFNMFS